MSRAGAAAAGQARARVEAGQGGGGGATCGDAHASFADTRLVGEVDGVAWPYRARAFVALNNPAGYECSREPQHHSSVFALLPPQFAERGVQCVGRLDQDTTGLLLLSDDCQFAHAVTLPTSTHPKIFRSNARHPP
ncbi:pseudouridine synthase, partial [Burkholderia mallei]|uniref:pseudouridine synthase n=1 Tax=Burkholderia mallei TaxID=13373 RepID=UPI001E4A1132